jgi:transcriptional regulator with XRE-family HTH domain
MLNARQCRTARAGLGWSVDQLAAVSAVSACLIRRFEAGEALERGTVLEIAKALSSGGAMFVDLDGKQGVLFNPLH